MGRRKVENDDYLGSLVNSGLFLFGTVDEVRAELVKQWRVFPAEYITLINHYALDEVIFAANRQAAE